MNSTSSSENERVNDTKKDFQNKFGFNIDEHDNTPKLQRKIYIDFNYPESILEYLGFITINGKSFDIIDNSSNLLQQQQNNQSNLLLQQNNQSNLLQQKKNHRKSLQLNNSSISSLSYSIEIGNDEPVDLSTIIIDKDCILDNLQSKGHHTELKIKGQQNNQENRSNLVINPSSMSNLDKLIYNEIQTIPKQTIPEQTIPEQTIRLDNLQKIYFDSIGENAYQFTVDFKKYLDVISIKSKQVLNDTDKNHVDIYINASLSDIQYRNILIIRDYYFPNECFIKQTEIINKIKEYKNSCKNNTESIQTFINPSKELEKIHRKTIQQEINSLENKNKMLRNELNRTKIDKKDLQKKLKNMEESEETRLTSLDSSQAYIIDLHDDFLKERAEKKELQEKLRKLEQQRNNSASQMNELKGESQKRILDLQRQKKTEKDIKKIAFAQRVLGSDEPNSVHNDIRDRLHEKLRHYKDPSYWRKFGETFGLKTSYNRDKKK